MNKQEFAQQVLRKAMVALGHNEPESLEGLTYYNMSHWLLALAGGYPEISTEEMPEDEKYFVVRSYTREDIAEMVNIDLSSLTDEDLERLAGVAGEYVSNTDAFDMAFEAAIERLHPDLPEIDDDEDDFDVSDFEYELGERVVAKKDLQSLNDMSVVIKAGTLGTIIQIKERLSPYDVAFDTVIGLFRVGDLDIDSAESDQKPPQAGRFCYVCGRKGNDNSDFCAYCGNEYGD